MKLQLVTGVGAILVISIAATLDAVTDVDGNVKDYGLLGLVLYVVIRDLLLAWRVKITDVERRMERIEKALAEKGAE